MYENEIMSIEELEERFRKLSSKKVHTSNGLKDLKIIHEIPQSFWNLWNYKKELLKSMNFSVDKNKKTGIFEICQWNPIDEIVKQYTVDNGNVPLDWIEYRRKRVV
jgi:hypothetical protein